MSHISNTIILIGRDKILSYQDEFERVFQAVNAPVTGRFLSIMIWFSAFPKYEPFGVLVKRNGQYVGAAILTRCRRFGIWRFGKPGGGFDPFHFAAVDAIAAKDLANAVCQAFEGLNQPWLLEITDLPEHDPVVTHLQKLLKCTHVFEACPAACLIFKPNTDLNHYISVNTRSAIAKAKNRLRREGIEMNLLWTRDPDNIKMLLPHIVAIYRKRDYQKYGQCLIDDPQREYFFVTFVKEHANKGLIDLLVIQFDDDIAAFALCLLDNGLHWVLVNRASPDWLKYSPGTIANAEVVIHAYAADDSNGVNWGGTLQRYKMSGDVTLIPRKTIQAWSSYIIRLICKFYGHWKKFEAAPSLGQADIRAIPKQLITKFNSMLNEW